MADDFSEFMGSTKARLRALEERAKTWDSSIDTLKKFHAKISMLGIVAMLLTSFLMNYIIKLLGLF